MSLANGHTTTGTLVLNNGRLSVKRTIPTANWSSPFEGDTNLGSSSQLVEYDIYIASDETLQFQKVQGRKSSGVNYDTTTSEMEVVADYAVIE